MGLSDILVVRWGAGFRRCERTGKPPLYPGQVAIDLIAGGEESVDAERLCSAEDAARRLFAERRASFTDANGEVDRGLLAHDVARELECPGYETEIDHMLIGILKTEGR